MAIFGNFKGTTQYDFKFGKRGVTVYTNSTIPITGVNTTNTIIDGDIWMDSANDTIQVRSSNNWVSIGNTLQSLNVANSSLVVDPSGNAINVGASSGLYVGNTHIIDGSGNWVGNIAGFGYTGSKGSINVAVSDEPDASPSVGDIWIDALTLIQYIYVNDGDSSQWIELSNPGAIGYTGSAGGGYTGSAGGLGYTGSQGAGFTGSTGITGFTGSSGIDGYTGSQGAGFTGSRGDIGPSALLKYSANTTINTDGTTNPGTGNINWDNNAGTGSQTDSSYVTVSKTTADSFNTAAIFASLSVGDVIYIQDQSSGSTSQSWTINSITNYATHTRFVVLFNNSTGSGDFSSNTPLYFSTLKRGTSGYTGSASTLVGYTGSRGFTGSVGYFGSVGFTGSLGYTGSRGFTGSSGNNGFTGSRGSDGTSVTILGTVADVSSLPGYPSSYTGTIGDGYLVNGDLYVWSGAAWNNVGAIQGPQGTPGYTGSIGYTGSSGSAGTLAATVLVIDGGGAAITTGIKSDIHFPFDCTIQEWTMLADTTGSATIDIWKAPYSGFPPTVANTITGSAKPIISSANKAQSSTLTGWTTSISTNDVLRLNVDSASTITRLTLSLKILRA